MLDFFTIFSNGGLVLCEVEESRKICAPTTMKKFENSEKAKKPLRTMIEIRVGEKPREKAKNSKKGRGVARRKKPNRF
ncbi:signal recognition particle receptor subunit alpha-like [Castor canadensis]|uniref:Signal recognition particle receptor subunit alpha-like n=1 Tax=Castor canadensis TaxID=51338 RepID=A0AC58LZL7_CASCN